MKKYLLIALLLITDSFWGYSQSSRIQWIDSLKKELPSLKDSARVDCLNELSKAFGTMGKNPARDSIYKYAVAANKDALKLGYKKGEAFSLLNLAVGDQKDPIVAIGYIKQAIAIGEKINNPKILGRAYMYWCYSLNGESRIETLKKALAYFKQSNDKEGELEANLGLCGDYTGNGNYEAGFKYCDECPKLIEQAKLTPWGHEIVLWYFSQMAEFYERVEDYETSLNYLQQGNQYAQNQQVEWDMDYKKIEAFTHLGQYDSAFYYLKKFESSATPYVIKSRAYWSAMIGHLYLKTKQYDKALAISKEGISFFKDQKRTSFALTEHLFLAGNVYAEMKNYKAALDFISEALKYGEKNQTGSFMMKGYQLIAGIYHHLGNDTKAYFYIQKHMAAKDSLINRQLYFRLNNYKKQVEEVRKTSLINLLNKDNQLKEQQLKQEASLKKFLIAGLILLLITGVFIFRYLAGKRKNEKLESEKKHAELLQRTTELEMQALRAQMNPHFIFNCLSSINKFILKNDTDAASDYLTRFSRLIRQVLTNSQLTLIPLSDEVEMLRLYLDMERLRFSESFTYNITYENTIEPETIYIPPMLLQPFCENAIWHGLMHKEGPGKLDVVMSIQNGELQCIIADNGIGRKKAAELKTKTGARQKSFGLKITTERLSLFNNEKTIQSFYNTEDLLDDDGTIAGTKVILKIKFKQTAADYVIN